MKSILLVLALALALGCGTSIYADHARCTRGEQVLYEGPVRDVQIADDAVALLLPDGSRRAWSGADIVCDFTREPLRE